MQKLKGLQLKKRTWYYTVTRNKERKYHLLGSVDAPESEILEAYHKWVAEYDEKKDRLMPLSRVWLAARQREVDDGLLSPKTLNEYRKHLAEHARLNQVFGSRLLDSIKPMEIQEYLDTGKRYQSNREVATLAAMLGWARNRGHVQFNATDGVERNREIPRDRYVTDEEFRVVYEAQPPALQDLMMIIYLTGLRINDVLNLRFADCFDEWLYASEGKTGKKVRFLWSDELKAVVERSRKRQPIGEFIIRRVDGQQYKHRHMAKEFRKGFPVGVEDFKLKDLRAKSATDREDPEMASYALGHSSQSITNRHYLRNQKGRLVSALDRAIGS